MKGAGLTVPDKFMKIRPMEADTTDNRGESAEEKTPQESETRPLSKLRDLRPEKDPIGAGRGGFLRSETRRP